MAAVVIFDADARWGDTLVCERRIGEALQAAGAMQGSGQAPAPTPDARVLVASDEPALCYLAHEGGWLGVLCDAGEWLMAPAVVWATTQRNDGLPSRERFLEELLSLLGEEQDLSVLPGERQPRG